MTTNEEMIRFFDTEVPAVDIITTKSFQVVPNPGNPEPVICETERGCFGNSVGLKNIGMEAAVEEMRRLRPMRALLNISLSASNPEDFITLVNAFIPYADMLELNFSCPHAARGYGASIGCDAGIAATYVRRIREAFPSLSVPLFVKLTPNVADIGAIAKSVVAAGANGITAINTVGPIVHIDPDSGESILINQVGGKGGKSGRWVFSTAVSSIRSIRKAVGPDVPIIGMGGVSTGEDAALWWRREQTPSVSAVRLEWLLSGSGRSTSLRWEGKPRRFLRTAVRKYKVHPFCVLSDVWPIIVIVSRRRNGTEAIP